MSQFNNIYGVLIIIGVVALIAVCVLYLLYCRRSQVGEFVIMKESEDQRDAGGALTEESIRGELVPTAGNQPLFVHQVTNLLQRAKHSSDIRVLKKFIDKMEVEADVYSARTKVLEKLEQLYESQHRLEQQQQSLQRRDKRQDLEHERDMKKIAKEIEELSQPSPVAPPPPDQTLLVDRFYRELHSKASPLKELQQLEAFRRREYADIEMRYPDDPEAQAMYKDAVDQFIDEFKTLKGW